MKSSSDLHTHTVVYMPSLSCMHCLHLDLPGEQTPGEKKLKSGGWLSSEWLDVLLNQTVPCPCSYRCGPQHSTAEQRQDLEILLRQEHFQQRSHRICASCICWLGVGNQAPHTGAQTTEVYCCHAGSRGQKARLWQDRVLRTGRGGPVPGFSLWLKDAFVLCPLFEDTCFESL